MSLVDPNLVTGSCKDYYTDLPLGLDAEHSITIRERSTSSSTTRLQLFVSVTCLRLFLAVCFSLWPCTHIYRGVSRGVNSIVSSENCGMATLDILLDVVVRKKSR